MANCAVKSSKGSLPCSIYKIEDNDEDKDYFVHLIFKPGWKDYLYTMIIDGDIQRGNAGDIFVIEDNKDSCLGYMEVFPDDKDKNHLEFLEVKPLCRAKNNKRSKKYTGETLLNFLAQITQKSGKNILYVPHPEPEAYTFYEKCQFSLDDGKRSFKLTNDNMEKLKKQNLLHTGKEIDFIG